MKLELEHVVIAELDSLGLDLVQLRVGGSRGRPVLDVRIDRRDLQEVRVADCERASRAIEARLDASPELIDGRYVLEVSSPGLEREIRSLDEWRRFIGRRASVKSPRFAAVGGWVELEIIEVAGEGAAARIVGRDARGNDIILAAADVQEARLAFHWQP